jgi:hypothetical protein
MKLNLNSTSAKLYRWLYVKEEMPQNLCPYFWKLVLMWVFIIPYTIISLPSILMNSVNRDTHQSSGERFGVGIILWFIIGMLISMLSWIGVFFFEPVKDTIWMHMLVIGFIGWGFSIVFSAIALFKWSKEKWQNRHVKYDENGWRIWEPVKEKESSIFVEFVKAKYKKYCPKIDWN